MMELEYIRDYVMYTAIFGMFSFIWSGGHRRIPEKTGVSIWELLLELRC